MLDGFVNPVAGGHRVLLVVRSEEQRQFLSTICEREGFRVDAVASIAEARARLRLLHSHVMLLDLDSAGEAEDQEQCGRLLGDLGSQAAAIPAILLATGKRLGSVAALLGRGATDYLAKPFSPDHLLQRVWIALLNHQKMGGAPEGTAESGAIPRRQPDRERWSSAGAAALPAGLLIGQSPAIERVIEQVRLVAPKRTSVLITGETGTGKERVARAIHALSRRQNRPMISVNCGGIPAHLLEDEFFGHVKGAFTDAYQERLGRFEQAQGSNIFLDEIGDLPLELQPKLLRVLQEREIHRVGGGDTIRVDARVIAATNVDLWSRVADGTFREDLFYRINVFPIHLPPLRERRDDIPLFVGHFLESFCRRDGLPPKRLDPGAEAALLARPWPGNIRELENAVEIAVILSQNRTLVLPEDLPEPRLPPGESARETEADTAFDYKRIVNEFERGLISRVLEQTRGNKTQAAELLRLKRTTLIEKLKKFENEDAPANKS